MLSKRDQKLEADYQAYLIDRLHTEYLPGCVVLKNDSGYQQGIPDLSVFYGVFWGWLEVKAHVKAEEQPNQRYFVELANQMSFGAFIYPENEEGVISDLQYAFRAVRFARVPQSLEVPLDQL